MVGDKLASKRPHDARILEDAAHPWKEAVFGASLSPLPASLVARCPVPCQCVFFRAQEPGDAYHSTCTLQTEWNYVRRREVGSQRGSPLASCWGTRYQVRRGTVFESLLRSWSIERADLTEGWTRGSGSRRPRLHHLALWIDYWPLSSDTWPSMKETNLSSMSGSSR